MKEQFESWFENDVVGAEVTFPAFAEGEYVEGDLYDDQLYFMLQAMWMAWQAAIASMQSERDQLAAQLADVVAENASLKDAIQSHSESVHFCEVCGKDDPCSTDDVCYVLKETPATDCFLDEQRASAIPDEASERDLFEEWLMENICISKSTLEGLRTDVGYRNSTLSGKDYNDMWSQWKAVRAAQLRAEVKV